MGTCEVWIAVGSEPAASSGGGFSRSEIKLCMIIVVKPSPPSKPDASSNKMHGGAKKAFEHPPRNRGWEKAALGWASPGDGAQHLCPTGLCFCPALHAEIRVWGLSRVSWEEVSSLT